MLHCASACASSAAAAAAAGVVPDAACPSGFADPARGECADSDAVAQAALRFVATIKDATTTAPQAPVAVMGGLTPDDGCDSGFARAGTFNPERQGPHCAPQSAVDSVAAAQAPATLGALNPDPGCPTRFHVTGTFDPARRQPFCATQAQLTQAMLQKSMEMSAQLGDSDSTKDILRGITDNEEEDEDESEGHGGFFLGLFGAFVVCGVAYGGYRARNRFSNFFAGRGFVELAEDDEGFSLASVGEDHA